MGANTAGGESEPAKGLDWPRLDACFDTHTMRVEELDEEGCFVVRFEIPGIDVTTDLDLRIRGHTLEIRAQRSQERSARHRGTRHSEFRYGRYWRVLTLPFGAEETAVEAKYRNGILEVRIPVRESASDAETRIPVTLG
jgi:HSP20 family molecular chaperone IbpA